MLFKNGNNIYEHFEQQDNMYQSLNMYQFTDKVNLKNLNKNMALANLSIYYTWKNIKPEYNNNKFKISAPTRNDEFNLPDGFFLFLIYKIILNTSSKKMKLLKIILLYKFM